MPRLFDYEGVVLAIDGIVLVQMSLFHGVKQPVVILSSLFQLVKNFSPVKRT